MSLVYAAIVPHTPLLIAAIGKEQREKLKKTVSAYQVIQNQLVLSRPETLIIISPHLSFVPDAFSINLSPSYSTHLKEFGDFSPPLNYKSNFQLIEWIRRQMRQENIHLILQSDEHLDYGTTVPLVLLGENFSQMALIPMSPSELDHQTHFRFGNIIKDQIMKTNRRIAIIASSNLSHKLDPESPEGFSPKAKIFDETLINFLKNRDYQGVLKMDVSLVQEAHACGYKPILILCGVIEKINVKPRILCYEHPFGVGYLSMTFNLK